MITCQIKFKFFKLLLKMADPIAALKALVDISKLKSGEDAAAEYLSKVRRRSQLSPSLLFCPFLDVCCCFG